MLTSSSQYRYITNPGPIAAGIHNPPHIVPVRDGTAAACIETYEDYCYLVELARERIHWSRGFDTPVDIAQDFDATSVVAKRAWLESLSRVARNSIKVPSRSEPCGQLRLDWSPASLPIFTNRSGVAPPSALEQFIESTGPYTRLSPTTVPRTIEIDTLRRIYSDFGDCKRWMFFNFSDPMTLARFNSINDFTSSSYRHLVPYSPAGTKHEQTGASSTTDSNSARWPYYDHYTDGGVTTQCYYPADGFLRMCIRTPFLTNPISITPYYSSVDCYLYVLGQMETRVGSGYDNIVVDCIMRHPSGSLSTTRGAFAGGNRGLDGWVDVPFNPTIMSSIFGAFESWATSNLQRYNNGGSVWIDGLMFDVGPVPFLSNLPDSWTWHPSA